MQLNWTRNANVSAFHAAWCATHLQDRVINCSEEIRNAAGGLSSLATQFGVSDYRFWSQLLGLSATVDYTGELAERLMGRLGLSSKLQLSLLASAIKDCRRHFDSQFPRYSQEVVLRAIPLQELWEAQGHGLLIQIGQQTEPSLLVDYAEIILVQPMLGGMGYANQATNRVHLEAVLTNLDDGLPETVRLAWLLSQLDLERPVYSEQIHGERLQLVSALAMIPPAISAACELGLCRGEPDEPHHELYQQAFRLWLPGSGASLGEGTPDNLAAWWETYQTSRPPVSIALAALDQMLGK
jgi:hypothetical protein